MLVRLFLVLAVVINIPCKDGEDVEDMEVSGSEASEGLCPESTSNSDCGECCGGHAPHPTLSMSPRSPNIIPGRDGTRTPFPEVPGIFSPLVEIGLTVWLKTGRAKAYLEYEPTISKYYSR